MPRIISDEIRRFLAEQANHCCEYCHAPSFLALAVVTSFEIEHIIPKSKDGIDEKTNLAFSCPRCNRLKSNRTEAVDPQTKSVVGLFHPRQQCWSEHFAHSTDGTQIIGLTPEGRATAQLLRFNDPRVIKTRRAWVTLGLYPPLNLLD